MSTAIPLFEINPELNRTALSERFARDRRIQIRNVLTDRTAREVHGILSRQTPWGLSWQAGAEGPAYVPRPELTGMSGQQNAELSGKIGNAMRGDDYAFAYSSYPILDAYLDRKDPGGPHDLLIEHINDEPFLTLVRDVTGLPELRKADAQATLYAPNNFLSLHIDSHVAEGWRIAYVLNLTAGEWRPDWGGYLLFFDEDGDVVAGYRPRFNALNLFAVPQKHSVSYVPPFAPVARYALTGWVRDR